MRLLTQGLGWFWYTVIRTRRHEMKQRIEVALGVNGVIAESVVKGVYGHLSESLVDVLIGFEQRRLVSKTTIEGWQHLVELHRRSSGFVVVTAHTGNWEILTHLDQLCGISGGFVSKRFSVKLFQRLLGWTRRRALDRYDEAGAARLMLQRLKDGDSIGFAVDQHTNRPSGISIDFLGTPAWWSTAPARLARMAQVPVVPIRTYRQGSGHVIEVYPPLDYEWSESRSDDIRAVTEWYARIVEEWIKDRPEQWLWLHRRWKPQRLKVRAEER